MSFLQRMVLSMIAVLLPFALVNAILVFTILYKADTESISEYDELLYENEKQAISSWLDMTQSMIGLYVDLSIVHPDSAAMYKDRVLNYLRRIKWSDFERRDNYFFAFEANSGSVLITNSLGLVKKESYVLDIQDLNGVEFMKEIRDRAVGGDKTPVHYLYTRKCFDCPPSEKMSSGIYIPEWDWVIATGSYVDKLKQKSVAFSERFNKSRTNLMENLFSVMLVSFLVGVAMILRQMRAFMSSFNGLSKYIHSLATEGIRYQDIDLPKGSQQEIEHMAKDMSEVIGNVGTLMDRVRGSADKVSYSTGNVGDMIGVVKFDAEVVGNRSAEMRVASENTMKNMQSIVFGLDSINKNLEKLRNLTLRVTTNASDITDSIIQMSDAIKTLNESSQSLRDHTMFVAQAVNDVGKSTYEELNKIMSIETEVCNTLENINSLTEQTSQLRIFISKGVSLIKNSVSESSKAVEKQELINFVNSLSEEVDTQYRNMVNIQLQLSAVHEIKIIPLSLVVGERDGVSKEIKEDTEALINSVNVIVNRISKINSNSQYISENIKYVTKDINDAFHNLEVIVVETDNISEHSKQTNNIMVELSKKSGRLMEAHEAIESTLLEAGKEMKQLNELSMNLRKIVDGLVHLENLNKKLFIHQIGE